MEISAEDLHWADPSTIRTVRMLIQRIERLPVALLLTRRAHPPRPDLDRVLERSTGAGLSELHLGSLDAGEADELASKTLGARLGPKLAAQIARATGNPLYIIELLTSLRSEDAIELTEGLAEVKAITMPASLRSTILRRLTALSDGAVEALQIASVTTQREHLLAGRAVSLRGSKWPGPIMDGTARRLVGVKFRSKE